MDKITAKIVIKYQACVWLLTLVLTPTAHAQKTLEVSMSNVNVHLVSRTHRRHCQSTLDYYVYCTVCKMDFLSGNYDMCLPCSLYWKWLWVGHWLLWSIWVYEWWYLCHNGCQLWVHLPTRWIITTMICTCHISACFIDSDYICFPYFHI